MPVVATIAPDTAPPAMAPPIPSLKGRPVQAFATTFETPPIIAPATAPITPKSQKSPSVSTLFTGSFSQYENTFLS